MKLRIIIADDEKLARDSINTLLSGVEGWEIISECKNGIEALNAINNFNPDLVFLDIQMPKLNGLEVIKSIKSKNHPYFILVTAYDSYAIQAFELSALDYLLKPYTDKRFYQALEKAEREIKLRKDQLSDIIRALEKFEKLNTAQNYRERFAARIKGKIKIIDVKDVQVIQASSPYVELQTSSRKYLVKNTITALEKDLNPKDFIRIHRSTIIRINQVKELQKYFNGEYLITMGNNKQLKLSRSYKDKVKVLLGNY